MARDLRARDVAEQQMIKPISEVMSCADVPVWPLKAMICAVEQAIFQ
jgi:hypothetical protein